MGFGDTTGVLRAGLSADCIVLHHNLFDIDPGQIHQTQMDFTYFQGD
ncbi:hypothetical protein [Streptomyces chartreusis]|uniref:Amidohydrolase family protein n=1 Tax=Streptomyces chartreusis TaxID=1969 RepID=A0A7H8T0W1_STRCX|nr:hypothetical protein [Streptomyces chartreusis]QKZ17146.1 hypothetical protein HUT05_07060 [Streptomyces chartreusis]